MRVFITGTSQGLGLELTMEGLKRGHEIVAAQMEVNEPVKALQTQYPGKISVEILDVCDWDAISRVSKNVRSRFGSIDGLINNAAVLHETKYFEGDPIVDMDLDDYKHTMDVNIGGVVQVCKAFLPLVYEGKDRFVLNITSEGAKLQTGGYIYPAYSVSKYALNMYTQLLRNYVEAKGKNVRVLMIHPGRMDTPMGVENAQISASESAIGIWDILEGKIKPEREDIPFINYKGAYMG